MPSKPKDSFEQSLKQLDKMVTEMEKGNLSLEDSLKHYSDGVKLIDTCQKALKKAEQQVTILNDKND